MASRPESARFDPLQCSKPSPFDPTRICFDRQNINFSLVFAGRKVVMKQATGDDFLDMLATLRGLMSFPAPA